MYARFTKSLFFQENNFMWVLLLSLIMIFFFVDPRATGADTDREKADYVGAVKEAVTQTFRLTLPAEKASARWRDAFREKNQIIEWIESKDIQAQFNVNPFYWKGNVVGSIGEFKTMLSEDSGLFAYKGSGNCVVVKNLPTIRFKRAGELALLAARVQGMTQVDTPLPQLCLVAIENVLPPKKRSGGQMARRK